MVSSLISALSGKLERVGSDWAEIAVGGITFRVNLPTSAVDRIGEVDEQVRVFTSLQVREDNLTLYGFITEADRMAFQTLLGVNGVGPKVALSVLSRHDFESLAVAVNTGDMDAFSAVSGVGKKTASRIVLELKGKLQGEWVVADTSGMDGDAVGALTALGYSLAEAREAMSGVPRGNSLSVEDKVRMALEHMGSLADGA